MYRTGIEPPQGVWWKPAHRSEKIWVAIAFAWCVILFAMMPIWHWKGGQNPSGIRYTVAAADYLARAEEFARAYQIGTEAGIPVVAPPAGSDVYLVARMWQWWPILQLERGVEYTIHLSSTDINHGFSLYPLNINFQVVPGYDYGLRMTPTEAGEFHILCNEFCGVGHHLMTGKIIVVDRATAEATPAGTLRAEGGDR